MTLPSSTIASGLPRCALVPLSIRADAAPLNRTPTPNCPPMSMTLALGHVGVGGQRSLDAGRRVDPSPDGGFPQSGRGRRLGEPNLELRSRRDPAGNGRKVERQRSRRPKRGAPYQDGQRRGCPCQTS